MISGSSLISDSLSRVWRLLMWAYSSSSICFSARFTCTSMINPSTPCAAQTRTQIHSCLNPCVRQADTYKLGDSYSMPLFEVQWYCVCSTPFLPILGETESNPVSIFCYLVLWRQDVLWRQKKVIRSHSFLIIVVWGPTWQCTIALGTVRTMVLQTVRTYAAVSSPICLRKRS